MLSHRTQQYARNALLFNISFVLPLHADTVRAFTYVEQ